MPLLWKKCSMSLAQQKQIDLLRKDVKELKRQNAWVINEIKNKMSDVLERVIKKTIDIDIVEREMTDDEKLTDLLALENRS